MGARRSRGRGLDCDFGFRTTAKQRMENARNQARLFRLRLDRRHFVGDYRCRNRFGLGLGWRNTLHGRFFVRWALFRREHVFQRVVFLRRLNHCVARRPNVGFGDVSATQAFNFVNGRFECRCRHEQNFDVLAPFNFDNNRALFVEQVGRHVDWKLGDDPTCVFLHRAFFEHTKNGQRQRFNGTNAALAFAARAGDLTVFAERGSQALT